MNDDANVEFGSLSKFNDRIITWYMIYVPSEVTKTIENIFPLQNLYSNNCCRQNWKQHD